MSGPRVVAVAVTLGLVETGAGVEALAVAGMVVLTETDLKAVVLTFGAVALLGLVVTSVALLRAKGITVEDGVDTCSVDVALIRSSVVVLREEGF